MICNLLRQPVFVQLRKDRPQAIRVVTADGRALTAPELELELNTSTYGEASSSKRFRTAYDFSPLTIRVHSCYRWFNSIVPAKCLSAYRK
jgi:hypothetical protein